MDGNEEITMKRKFEIDKEQRGRSPSWRIAKQREKRRRWKVEHGTKDRKQETHEKEKMTLKTKNSRAQIEKADITKKQ